MHRAVTGRRDGLIRRCIQTDMNILPTPNLFVKLISVLTVVVGRRNGIRRRAIRCAHQPQCMVVSTSKRYSFSAT